MSTRRGSSGRRIVAATLLGIATLIGVATLRMWLDGRRHFDEAEQLSKRGEVLRAIPHYEDAARAYFPGSPYPSRALKQLAIMAKGQEMRGDTREAASTWEAVRRAILSTRHFRQPQEERLAEAERELARLRGPTDDESDVGRGPIARPRDPSPVASLLLFLGLLAWIGGALTLCLAPAKREHGAVWVRRSAAWLVCLGGLILWVSMAWIAV